MGCDIHLRLEKRDDKCDWIDSNLYDKNGQIVEPFTGRSYSTFAYLAGVRNRDDVEPISEPRGYPEDISSVNKTYFDSWDCDIHSVTYFTLAELLEASAEIDDTGLTYFTSCIETAANAFYCDYRPEAFRVIIGFDN